METLNTTPAPKTMIQKLEETAGKYLPVIEKLLPTDQDANRFIQLLIQECRVNPKLVECKHSSVIMNLLQICRLGLEPGGVLGQAYLIPRKNKGTLEATLQLGYKGVVELIYRSPQVGYIETNIVREGDLFEWEYGTDGFIRHKPTELITPTTKVLAYYAIVKMTNGTGFFKVMWKSEVEAHKKKYVKYDSDAWKGSYDSMALKTVITKLSNTLPKSVHYSKAIESDSVDAGHAQKVDPEVKDAFDGLDPKNEIKDGPVEQEPLY